MMSNIEKGEERVGPGLSKKKIIAGQIGRLITISTTPVIAGDSFEMDAVGALRLSPLRRGLAIDSTVDIFTFYVPHRHVYGEQCIFFKAEGGIRDYKVTGVQTCALPISPASSPAAPRRGPRPPASSTATPAPSRLTPAAGTPGWTATAAPTPTRCPSRSRSRPPARPPRDRKSVV